MATAGGPKIKKDGLVFGYDTGRNPSSTFDSKAKKRRFFSGKPTTNLVGTTLSMTGWQGSYSLVDSATKTFNITTQQSNAATTSAWRTFYWSVSSYVGQYVSISADVKFIQETDCTFSSFTIGQGNTGTYIYHIAGSDAADRVTIGTRPYDTTRMSWSGVINATGIVGFTLWINNVAVNNANCTIQISNVQVEVSSYPSPFVNGSRSSTGALIDLKKSANIDVSNVSFDSDGLMTFDGTDDSLVLADPNVSSANGFSIELVIKPNNASSSPMVIVPNSGGIDHFVRFNGSGTLYLRMIVAADSTVQDFTTSTSLSSSQYHHVVFTFIQASGGAAYYNGNLEYSASANFTALDWTSTWRVGQRGNNTYFFNGAIPVLKIYNRTLSATEIKENFKAYKNRFNL